MESVKAAPAKTNNRHPWERLDAETESNYLQFLFYRNLGPTRTLDRAYRKYLADTDLNRDVPDGTVAPGSWGDSSVRHEWVHRSQAWDIWRLQTYGHRVAPLFVYALECSLLKLCKAVEENEVGSKPWRSVLDTIRTLGEQLDTLTGNKRGKREDSGTASADGTPQRRERAIRVGGDQPA